MAPFAMRTIAAQVERVTARNVDDVAQKIVDSIQTRDQVQRTAVLVARRASRWYSPSFHVGFDSERRNLCDNFVKMLLQRFAARTKAIRGVPLPGIGLSGAALLKSDLLGTWVFDKGTTGIGPIAVALFNAGQLSLHDMQAVIESCLDATYLSSNSGKYRGDALLLLEVAGRDLDGQDPRKLNEYIARLSENYDAKPKGTEDRTESGRRTIPSLKDRLGFLSDMRKRGWRISPYASGSATPTSDGHAKPHEAELNKSDPVPTKTADHSSESIHSDNTSLYDDNEEAEASSSQIHTPSTPSQSDVATSSAAFVEQRRKSDMLGMPFTPVHISDLPIAKDDVKGLPAYQGESYDSNAEYSADVTRTVSPWTAYFSSAINRSHGLGKADDGSREPRNAQTTSQTKDEAADDNNVADDASIHSAADLAWQRRESAASHASNVKRRPLPLPPPRTSSQGVHVSFGQALEGGLENAPPAGASRAASLRKGTSSKQQGKQSAILPSTSTMSHLSKQSIDQQQKPVAFDDHDAIWINLDTAGQTSPSVRVRFPPQFRLGDARRLARLFSAAMQGDDVDTASSIIHYASAPIYFLPGGLIGQTLPFESQAATADDDDNIFVEYASRLTLAEARSAAQKLANTLAAYQQNRQRAASMTDDSRLPASNRN